MGGWFSKSKQPKAILREKRKIHDTYPNDKPLKKRLRCTYDYVYRELFCKGEGSDLTVKCLQQTWTLHRLYVKQSPFFSAMLDGGWKESESSVIELELSDPNITTDSLKTVFGSFYRDNIYLSDSTVLGVLAASTWFHMDDIRGLCSDFMIRRLCFKNVIDYFNISQQYNIPELLKSAVGWLADNLLLLEDSDDNFQFLKSIPVDFMRQAIERPDLVVVQVEQDVFLLLLKWVFLLTHTEYKYQPGSSVMEEAYRFFVSKGPDYLVSPEGAIFAPVFKAIRWEHVVNVYRSTERMLHDRLIPEAWLSQAFGRQWLRLLRSHEMHTTFVRSTQSDSENSSTHNHGDSSIRNRQTLASRQLSYAPFALDLSLGEPGPPMDLAPEVFWETSERCGRRMQSGDTTCSWRWTGYHFGFDVVVKYKRRTFSVIRFSESHNAEGSISHAPVLRLLVSLRVKSIPGETVTQRIEKDESLIDVVNCPESNFDRSGEWISSGLLSLRLEENVLHEVIRLPDTFSFPAIVSANILRYDPVYRTYPPHVCLPTAANA